MKSALVTELHPGHFRLVLNTTVLFWRGTRAAVLSALRSLGYAIVEVP